ncbi:MAG: hypothetical protein R3F11_25380 [Verrucomicrobiales bacterium]
MMTESIPQTTETAAPNTVEQIREVLIGGHLRKIESRIEDLERRCLEAMARSREAERRAEQAESVLANAEELVRRSTEEARGEMERRLSDLRESVEALDSKHEDDQKRLHGEVLDQSRFIFQELESTINALSGEMKRGLSELREGKADREAIRSALRLAEEAVTNAGAGIEASAPAAEATTAARPAAPRQKVASFPSLSRANVLSGAPGAANTGGRFASRALSANDFIGE